VALVVIAAGVWFGAARAPASVSVLRSATSSWAPRTELLSGVRSTSAPASANINDDVPRRESSKAPPPRRQPGSPAAASSASATSIHADGLLDRK
jgi:hypothetical protein